MTIKFEIGKTYAVPCKLWQDGAISFSVVSRTAKTVTVKIGAVEAKRFTVRVNADDCEYVRVVPDSRFPVVPATEVAEVVTVTPDFCLADLRQFTGSETWTRHPIARNVLYTEGMTYVAEKAGAYWLIDEIALAQVHVPQLKGEEFQKWTLVISNDSSAVLEVDDGNGRTIYTKRIEFTDFPESGLKVYVEGPHEQRTILLPSEH